MDELKRQIDILIDKTEERKLHQMLFGNSAELRETIGELNAFKLIRLLIKTNLKFVIDKNFNYDNI